MRNLILIALTAIMALFVACGPKEDPIEPTPANVPVSGVTLNQQTIALNVGATGSLTATVNPANATDKTVTWSSSNSSVATVQGGTVTAVAEGTSTITATAGGKSATCQVTVSKKVIPITNILLNHDSMELDVKGTFQLYATVYPEDATDKVVTWSSSDENIATVDENGIVTGVNDGTATITAAAGGKEDKCEFKINPVSPKAVHLETNKITVELKDTLRLSFTYEPEYAKVESVRWSTDNGGIWVDEDGLIHADKEGTANIKVILGAFVTDICEVTVVTPDYVDKERAALIKLFNANNGNNWNNFTKQNWCSDEPLEYWTGVGMTPDGKHVQSVWLNDENLKGQIPKEIADLTELEVFKMVKPNGIPTNGYPIPSEIGNLKKLKNLTLWTYTVSGTIPKSIYKIQSLEELVLGYIPLSSWTIPSDISNLKNLKELSLPGCNLTGKIPDWIGHITGLEVLDLSSNKLSGSVPASIGSLINLKELDLSSNSLSGSIPTAVAKMDNYWRLWPYIFRSNNFTMDNLRDSKIPFPRSPKITTLSGKELEPETEFKKNQYTVLFNMNPGSGDAVECLTQLASLYKVNKSKGLGIITCFDNNSAIETDRNARDAKFKEVHKKVGATWDSFIRYMYEDYPDGAPFFAEKGDVLYPSPLENCIVIFGPDQTVVYTTLFDKSREYLNNAVAYLEKVFKTTITHYESKSYAQDGKVTTLHRASTGKGIDLVITGDAFSDRKISDGSFKKAATQAVADMFSVEPYKSMKDRFNIYLVNAVSKHEEYFNGNSTVFSGVFGYGSAVGGDNQKVLEYAQKAVSGSTRMDNVAVLVLMNTVRSGGTCYMMNPVDQNIYAGGAAVCWVPFKDVTVTGGLSDQASTIVHELGGHGIAKLADEYAYRDQGKISTESANYIMEEQKNKDWYLNVDFTSDPKKVLWSQFIGDSAFSSENIGVYEGGYTFWSGVWRPTENSVMNNNYTHFTFNAPCRSLAWTRIMKLSEGESWSYDYNAFKTWDKAHPTSTRATTRSIVEIDGEAPVHVPPVIVGKTWKEVIEGR